MKSRGMVIAEAVPAPGKIKSYRRAPVDEMETDESDEEDPRAAKVAAMEVFLDAVRNKSTTADEALDAYESLRDCCADTDDDSE